MRHHVFVAAQTLARTLALMKKVHGLRKQDNCITSFQRSLQYVRAYYAYIHYMHACNEREQAVRPGLAAQQGRSRPASLY